MIALSAVKGPKDSGRDPLHLIGMVFVYQYQLPLYANHEVHNHYTRQQQNLHIVLLNIPLPGNALDSSI